MQCSPQCTAADDSLVRETADDFIIFQDKIIIIPLDLDPLDAQIHLSQYMGK